MIRDEKSFYDAMRSAMEEVVKQALEPEIEAACERLRQKLREQVANIVLRMFEHYSAQTYGKELVITVRPPGMPA